MLPKEREGGSEGGLRLRASLDLSFGREVAGRGGDGGATARGRAREVGGLQGQERLRGGDGGEGDPGGGQRRFR